MFALCIPGWAKKEKAKSQHSVTEYMALKKHLTANSTNFIIHSLNFLEAPTIFTMEKPIIFTMDSTTLKPLPSWKSVTRLSEE